MTSNTWFLGIDLGTSSCKCAAVDAAGQLLALSGCPYPHLEDNDSWKTQDPELIYQGMVKAVRKILSEPGVSADTCRAASMGCALHGLMVLDSANRPISPVYTWVDDRAASQADRFARKPQGSELYQHTGCPPHGMYPIYKILWLHENRPEIMEKANRLLSVKAYLFARLAGEFLVDYSMASGSGLLDIHQLQWNSSSLHLAGIEASQLSSLSDPVTVMKIRDRDFLENTDLPNGLPLILGSSDAVNSTLGAGAVLPGQATCMIGTSGAYRVLSPEPRTDPEASTWCYALDRSHWLIGGAINNGGLALTWLSSMIPASSQSDTEVDIEELLHFAELSPPGSEGLICLPLFAGERSPHWTLDARGTFFGLAMHHNFHHMARSVLEGIAFRLRSIDEILKPLAGPITEVRASGGFTRSAFWSQLTCDVLHQPLAIPGSGETSALGSAFWALMGMNQVSSLEDLGGLVPIRTTYQPDPETADMYDSTYTHYQQLYSAVSPLFTPLAEFQNHLASKRTQQTL